MITTETRAAVRAAYQQRCGYCGVFEVLAGGELEVDHFKPLAHGGDDATRNLVYCCPACNRFKSNYWPAADAPESFHLLHPGQDDFSAHIVESINGRLAGLTSRGWFHIRWLHLNRAQLVEMRLLRQNETEMLAALTQAHQVKAQLQARIGALEKEIEDLHAIIAQLTQ